MQGATYKRSLLIKTYKRDTRVKIKVTTIKTRIPGELKKVFVFGGLWNKKYAANIRNLDFKGHVS